jgi:diguanylate cyclase (GGDEF)-like protein
VSRWIASGTGFALLLVNLDQFKVVNGLAAARRGDWLLRQVAQVADALDPQAPAFRFSGDEFVVLLPIHDRHEAVRFGQRIRAAVSSLDLSASGEPDEPDDPAEWRLDCSIGIARWPGDAGTTEALLAAADKALVAAKRRGGASVVSATNMDW